VCSPNLKVPTDYQGRHIGLPLHQFPLLSKERVRGEVMEIALGSGAPRLPDFFQHRSDPPLAERFLPGVAELALRFREWNPKQVSLLQKS